MEARGLTSLGWKEVITFTKDSVSPRVLCILHQQCYAQASSHVTFHLGRDQQLF